MPRARFGVGFGGGPVGHHPWGNVVPNAYPRNMAGRYVEHPSVTHARMAGYVYAGVHPADAQRRAAAEVGRRVGRASVGVARGPGAGDVAAQVRTIVDQFRQLYGIDARVQIAPYNGGPAAESFANPDGSATIVIDPGTPSHALPAVVAHEMAHALQIRQGRLGRSGSNPSLELEATYVAGQFLRRKGYPLQDALRYLEQNYSNNPVHGGKAKQLDALRRGYRGG